MQQSSKTFSSCNTKTLHPLDTSFPPALGNHLSDVVSMIFDYCGYFIIMESCSI